MLFEVTKSELRSNSWFDVQFGPLISPPDATRGCLRGLLGSQEWKPHQIVSETLFHFFGAVETIPRVYKREMNVLKGPTLKNRQPL